ncbi:MAG TPA: PDZ domain-containing protein, partial [Thermoanaerobaculia bacterium]
MHSRRAIAATGLAITIAFLALVAWRASVWHAHGWTGIRYVAGAPKDMPVPEGLRHVVPKAGLIDVVLPGSPAEKAGIRSREVILSIDGIALDSFANLAAHGDLSRRGDAIVYRIEHHGKERTVTVRSASPLTFPSVAGGVITGVVMMLAFLAIAFLVIWHRPKARSARIFFWFCVSGSAWSAITAFVDLDMMAADGIYAAFSRLPVFMFYLLALAVANAFETVLLHLSLVFPRELPLLQKRPWLVGWMYAVPFTLALLPFGLIAVLLSRGIAMKAVCGALLAIVAVLLLARRSEKPWLHRPVSLLGTFITVLLAVIAVAAIDVQPIVIALLIGGSVLVSVVSSLGFATAYAIATLVALLMGYRRSSAEEKRQLRWPLWGTSIAIAVQLVVTTLMLTLSSHSSLLMLVAGVMRVVYLLIPLTFAFAILKYRLMEIDVVIKKTVVYSIATGLVVAVFFVIVAGIGSYITATLNIRSQTLTVMATLAVVAAFVPLRNRVQRSVERRFFQRSYDATEAEKLIQQEIVSASTLEDLLPRIAEYVQQALQVKSVLLFTQRDDESLYRLAAKIGVARETLGNLALDAASIARIDDVAETSALR